MKKWDEFRLSQIRYKSGEHAKVAALFDCGNTALNQYLAASNEHGDTAIYIFLDEYAGKIAAYASLICSSLVYAVDGKEFQIPAIEIKAFAVDKACQNLPVSENADDGVLSDKIFNQLIAGIYEIAETIVSADYITLYSVESAQKFYERNGFTVYQKEMSQFYNYFNESCIPMYMEL